MYTEYVSVCYQLSPVIPLIFNFNTNTISFCCFLPDSSSFLLCLHMFINWNWQIHVSVIKVTGNCPKTCFYLQKTNASQKRSRKRSQTFQRCNFNAAVTSVCSLTLYSELKLHGLSEESSCSLGIYQVNCPSCWHATERGWAGIKSAHLKDDLWLVLAHHLALCMLDPV